MTDKLSSEYGVDESVSDSTFLERSDAQIVHEDSCQVGTECHHTPNIGLVSGGEERGSRSSCDESEMPRIFSCVLFPGHQRWIY